MPSLHLVLIALLAAGATATAAPPAQPRQPDPLAAAAPAPPLAYASAFDGYRADQELKLADWKASNAAVAGKGGHAGHAMPAMKQPDAKAADPHAEHKH